MKVTKQRKGIRVYVGMIPGERWRCLAETDRERERERERSYWQEDQHHTAAASTRHALRWEMLHAARLAVLRRANRPYCCAPR